jgi:hypothetical protein
VLPRPYGRNTALTCHDWTKDGAMAVTAFPGPAGRVWPPARMISEVLQ